MKVERPWGGVVSTRTFSASTGVEEVATTTKSCLEVLLLHISHVLLSILPALTVPNLQGSRLAAQGTVRESRTLLGHKVSPPAVTS